METILEIIDDAMDSIKKQQVEHLDSFKLELTKAAILGEPFTTHFLDLSRVALQELNSLKIQITELNAKKMIDQKVNQ
jgi:hypothetical protein